MGTNNDACCNVSNRPHHFAELNNPYLSISLAIAFTIPILASTLVFIVYALLGNSMNPAIIFTSHSLFSLLQQPLFLPQHDCPPLSPVPSPTLQLFLQQRNVTSPECLWSGVAKSLTINSRSHHQLLTSILKKDPSIR